MLEPRVRENIEQELRIFLLAGPPDVGIAQLHFREHLHTGTPICYLEELYVVPDRRGESHGRRLMDTAFEVARGHGASNIELGTSVDDTAAQALYESLGFTNLEKADRPETQMLFYERDL